MGSCYADAFRSLFWGLFFLGLIAGAAGAACSFGVYKASQHVHIEVK